MGADTTRLHSPSAVDTNFDVLLSYGFQRSNSLRFFKLKSTYFQKLYFKYFMTRVLKEL